MLVIANYRAEVAAFGRLTRLFYILLLTPQFLRVYIVIQILSNKITMFIQSHMQIRARGYPL